jgi:hypothetical protein
LCEPDIKRRPKLYRALKEEKVIFCTQCGATLQNEHQYCWSCGTKAERSGWIPRKTASPVPYVPAQTQRPTTPRRFGQIFGLDPRVAFLTLIIDVMLNAGDLVSMGLLLPVSIGAGIVLGFIAYRAQITWYGDDPESAKIKGLVLGLLTAIPTPLPELLYIPAGLLGLVQRFRSKESHT